MNVIAAHAERRCIADERSMIRPLA